MKGQADLLMSSQRKRLSSKSFKNVLKKTRRSTSRTRPRLKSFATATLLPTDNECRFSTESRTALKDKSTRSTGGFPS